MNLPWKELGLSRFLVTNGDGALLFTEGRPRSSKRPQSLGDLLQVAYRPQAGGKDTIDLHLLSRTVLPTLPDHTLASLCTYYHIPLAQEGKLEAVGLLFSCLLADVLEFNRDLLSLLSQLLPSPTGNLLSRLVPLAKQPTPPAIREEAKPEEAITSPLSLKDALSCNGPIAQGLASFEDRPGQQDMAQRVFNALEKGATLAVEAGPGTGKTFAYLIPALLYLRNHDNTRLILSTRTKQLQEQVYSKDLPFLISRLFPQLKVTLLKGRKNYVCLRRWQGVLGELIEGLERDLLPALAPLASWLFQTETGDIEENSAFLADPRARGLWNRLNDDPHRCLGPFCPFFDDCFSIAARRRAKRADLVVVNHSLLLADQQTDQGILGDYQYLIVDEAHALEGAARQAFTETLATRTLEGLLWELDHPVGHRAGGWITHLPFPASDKRGALVHELQGSLRSMNTRLFPALAQILPVEQRGRYTSFNELRPQVERLVRTLDEFRSTIETLAEALDTQESTREAEGLIAEIEEVAHLFTVLFSPPVENTVHWYERIKEEVVLHSSPLEVAPFLHQTLYKELDGLILTSATLSLGEGFTYLKESLGLSDAPGETDCTVVEETFSYEERMRLYLPEFFPPVTGPVEEYAAAIASCAQAVAKRTERKVLVLFTSYQLLHAVHQMIGEDERLLAQGIDGPRSKVIERFRRYEGGAILLGTDSFWEGVDLPGSALEILIITRLPFPVPTDPIFSALRERLSKVGKDPFLDLSIPQAILKLRQGVGRLIRTRSDRGVIILTDQRILYKGYRHLFTASLPVKGRKVASLNELLGNLDVWFTSSVSGPHSRR